MDHDERHWLVVVQKVSCQRAVRVSIVWATNELRAAMNPFLFAR